MDASCFGSSDGSATATPLNGTANYTYSWSPAGGNGQTTTGIASGAYTVTVTDNLGCTTTATATVNQPPQLVLTTGAQSPSCPGDFDGMAWVTAVGGTPGYTYVWNSVPAQGTDTAFNVSRW